MIRKLIALPLIVALSVASPLRPQPRLPDGVAYRDSPLSMNDMVFLEGRWDSAGSGERISHRRVRPGVMLMSSRGGGAATWGPAYLTRHGGHIYLSVRPRDWKVRPLNFFSERGRTNSCFWVNRIERLPNGDVSYFWVDDDATLTVNPWLDRSNVAKHPNCTSAYLLGMHPSDQERLVLVIARPEKQIGQVPLRRLGPLRR